MDTRGLYRVGGNGVTLRVGSANISYGQGSAALRSHAGRDVLILLNPDDISHCWAFTPDRRPIGRLEANRQIAPGACADDAREAIAERMRERSVMHQAGRSSAKRTRTMAQRINEHSRAVHAEQRATGTDAADARPNILPVETGFEGGSKPDRSAADTVRYAPWDPADLEQLIPEDDPYANIDVADIDVSQDMDVLFDDRADVTDDVGDGPEALL
jgi:hypothetical protein